jgi:hypothetical protein
MDNAASSPTSPSTSGQHRTGNQSRVPFSYLSILEAMGAQESPPSSDFGQWEVDEIQLCSMGSWDNEGAYRSVGGIHIGYCFCPYNVLARLYTNPIVPLNRVSLLFVFCSKMEWNEVVG